MHDAAPFFCAIHFRSSILLEFVAYPAYAMKNQVQPPTLGTKK